LFQRFLDFLSEIRKHPWLKDAFIIYIGERNTGQVSASHGTVIAEMFKGNFVRDPDKPDAGVWTTRERKVEYLDVSRDQIARRGLRFLKDCIVICERTEKPATRFIEMKKELFRQLYRIKPLASRTGADYTPAFVSWSGKLGEDGKPSPDLNDDLAFAFFLCMYWMIQDVSGRLPNQYFKYPRDKTQEFRVSQKHTAVHKIPAVLLKR
jgi:hypothetical protein